MLLIMFSVGLPALSASIPVIHVLLYLEAEVDVCLGLSLTHKGIKSIVLDSHDGRDIDGTWYAGSLRTLPTGMRLTSALGTLV